MWSVTKDVLKDDFPQPKDILDGLTSLHTLKEKNDPYANLDCNQALDKIINGIPNLSSLYYFVTTGYYLGQMGDYTSCVRNSIDSGLFTATVTGDYVGSFPYARGAFGKYLPNFVTQMGICAPKQCSVENITHAYGDLI